MGDEMDDGHDGPYRKRYLDEQDEIRYSIINLGRTWSLILGGDDVWVDAEKHEWKLDEMSYPHRKNVVQFIRRRVESIRLAVDLHELSTLPNTFLPDGVDTGLDQAWAMSDLEWLDQWPLWIRLNYLNRKAEELTARQRTKEIIGDL